MEKELGKVLTLICLSDDYDDYTTFSLDLLRSLAIIILDIVRLNYLLLLKDDHFRHSYEQTKAETLS